MSISEHAGKLHKQAIIIDGHNDTLILRLFNGDKLDIAERDTRYHLDIPRAMEGGLTGMFSFIGDKDLTGDRSALELLDATLRMAERHPQLITYATRAEDIEQAKAGGKFAVIGQMESCTCFAGRLSIMRLFHRLGVRVAGLTHGEGGRGTAQREKSCFDYVDSADRERWRGSAPGLTGFGRELVAEANKLGMLIDLAHIHDAAFYEVLELSEAPVVFSHGGVFSQCPHSRCLTDDQLEALAAKGGVAGIAFCPRFIDRDNPTMERLVDSFEYAVNLVGPDYVGFGGDYDGMKSVPIPARVELLPSLTEALVARGFDDETILKILGGNFLRVFRQAVG